MKLVILLSMLVGMQAYAYGPEAGDEDPFPLLCANFSGNWKSDDGQKYAIQQRECSWLRMQMSFGSEQASLTIVPDNKTRLDAPSHAQVRHRWNSPKNGTVLETHRIFQVDNKKITEVTMLESAGTNLLLETTYRAIDCPPAKVRHEYEQQMFRRVLPEDAGDQVAEPSNGKRTKH